MTYGTKTARRGKSATLTKPEKNSLFRDLKSKALLGDTQAALALSNFELANATQQQIQAPFMANGSQS